MPKNFSDYGPHDDREDVCPDCDEELCARCAAGVAYHFIQFFFFTPIYVFEHRNEFDEMFRPRLLLAAPKEARA